MTVPGNLSSPLLATAAEAAAAGVATKSLRFNTGDSSFLSRTPSSAGNRRTWTWAAWVKRNKIDTGNNQEHALFVTSDSGGNSDYVTLYFNDSGYINTTAFQSGSTQWSLKTAQVFRDVGAWMHIVWAVDLSQSTASNRVKLYCNGSQITDFITETYPSSAFDTRMNSTNEHSIGRASLYDRWYASFQLADIYFIDGSQLDPTSFGAYDDNGVWQAAAYSGTYGTNGFHLLDFANESTVGHDSSGNDNDFTANNLSATGAAASSAAVLNLPLNSTPFADSSASSATVTNTGSISTTSAATNTFNISTVASLNGSSQRLTTNNNNISFQNNWTVDAYFIIDNGSTAFNALFNSGYGSQTSHYMYIGFDNSNKPFVETSSSGSRTTAANAINKNQWYHIRVIQKSGTITMYINGTSVLTKTAQTTDLSSQGSNTIGSFLDNANNANNFFGQLGPFRIINDALDAPSSGGEATSSGTLANTGTKTVASEIDVLFDVPTNGTQSDTGAGGEVSGNYATLNPLNKHASSDTISNGNLEASWSGGSACIQPSTIAFSSGKYYYEFSPGISGSIGNGVVGIRRSDSRNHSNTFAYLGNGQKMQNESASSYGSSYTDGDVIGVAVDMDAGTIRFYKNGADQGQAYSGISGTYTFYQGTFGGSNGGGYAVNFGQRPFAYSAPSGFKALCTTNLPTPTIADGSTAFDVRSGLTAQFTISDLKFAADLIWGKSTSNNEYWIAANSLDNFANGLKLNETSAEGSGTPVTNVTATGYQSSNNWFTTGRTYVTFNWDGGNLATNTAYNQADVWSDRLSGTVLSSSLGYKNAFDGDTSTATHPANGNTITFTPSTAISVTSSIKIYFQIGSITGISGTADITINGTSYVSNANSGRSNGHFTVTGVSSITSIAWERAADNDLVVVTAIEVDGKKLVDAGVIPADSVSSGVPSIASTARANPTAGISILTFTSPSSSTSSYSVGHGLNAEPEFWIWKSRGNTGSWQVYFTALGSSNNRFNLNTDGAVSSSYPGSATSSVINLSDGPTAAFPGTNIIYAFAPVAGFSAFGKYTGNGSSEGPFVHTGFRPAFLLFFATDGTHRVIYDSARDTDNPVSKQVATNLQNSESDQSRPVDFLSNGFKIRFSSYLNDNNDTIVYACFAENPFQANGGLAR